MKEEERVCEGATRSVLKAVWVVSGGGGVSGGGWWAVGGEWRVRVRVGVVGRTGSCVLGAGGG